MKQALCLAALAATTFASPYKGGEVSTHERFTYGRFKTKMRVPQMPKGTVASFFTFWNGPGWYDGGWNEIDVEVVPSMGNTKISYNLIYGTGKGHTQSHKYADMPDGAEWVEHQIDWTPEYIKFYVNGELKRDANTYNAGVVAMKKAQPLYMNFWTPSWSPWGDGRNDSSMPWYADYDYVEVSKYNSETKDFDFYWRDDFDTLDLGRWAVSSKGAFGGSLSSFATSQVNVT